MQALALQLLRQALADNAATFRDGQLQAISALVERRARLLVVQRTGWGKSLVYFLATRLLRDRGAGYTILISPLLSLMRNQIAAARRIGVRAETMNSTNQTEWRPIEARLHRNEIELFKGSCLLGTIGSWHVDHPGNPGWYYQVNRLWSFNY